jgi:hypothetical protein
MRYKTKTWRRAFWVYQSLVDCMEYYHIPRDDLDRISHLRGLIRDDELSSHSDTSKLVRHCLRIHIDNMKQDLDQVDMDYQDLSKSDDVSDSSGSESSCLGSEFDAQSDSSFCCESESSDDGMASDENW